ncbi:hypothetical protein ASD76_11150 [Altererythrobacter sp. Root672]|nr:hypothetical protein ASD76_11150 [Altererythrobacter sp. Root672]
MAERNARGGFRSINDLRTIEGITDEDLAALKANVFVRGDSRQRSAKAGRSGSEKEARPPTVFSAAIDASFQADANVRGALTENLKPLRADAEAIDVRLQAAFKNFTADTLIGERGQRHYVAPGSNPSGELDQIITQRVKELRSGGERRGLALHDTPELRRLVKKGDNGKSVVDLGKLIEYIDRKSRTSTLVTEPEHAPLAAEIEAERLLVDAERPGENGNGQGVVRRKTSALEARDVSPMVEEAVAVQMESVTAPETQLTYGKIPNSADDDKVQKEIRENFELRIGASDVTAYHDFHTLQIAFRHVWTRIFDGQLTTLGQDLYREYVRLKDFSGSTAADIPVGSLEDLRRLMDEIKKLSQFVDEETPDNLRPGGSEAKSGGLPTPTPEDAARGAVAVATGGASLFIEWAFNELIKAGNRPVRVTWAEFPLKLNEGRGNIIELRPPEQNVMPPGAVEMVLETDSNSYKKKITFQQWDRDSQRPIYSADLQNFGGGHGPIDRVVLNASQMQNGTLKFISEDEVVNELLLGRYVLGELGERLMDRTRLTFRWKGQR